MKVTKRPRFLLDLAEELTWLKDHAGAEVAECWYEALLATIQFIRKNPHAGIPAGRRLAHPIGVEPITF